MPSAGCMLLWSRPTTRAILTLRVPSAVVTTRPQGRGRFRGKLRSQSSLPANRVRLANCRPSPPLCITMQLASGSLLSQPGLLLPHLLGGAVGVTTYRRSFTCFQCKSRTAPKTTRLASPKAPSSTAFSSNSTEICRLRYTTSPRAWASGGILPQT